MAHSQGPTGIPGKGPAPRVDPQRAPSAPARPKGKSEFAGLLEKIRHLEEKTKAAGLTGEKKGGSLDPAALVRRLEEAERTFRKAMEIRRVLEEAWRTSGKNPYPGGIPGAGGRR